MIRSYLALACALWGVLVTLLVQRDLEMYLVILLVVAVPWDKLANMAGELAEQYLKPPRNPAPVEQREEAGSQQ